ncbi:MAG: NuoI/complex I 23 kDa subunit family protein [bacterium]
MDIRRRSYFVKVFKGAESFLVGLFTTLKYLLSPPVTLQYPRKRWTIPPRSRGRIGLVRDKETGRSKCTGCGICSENCPALCIWVEQKKDPETGKPSMKAFYLDFTICIFCATCVEVCPFNALCVIPEEYEFSTFIKDDLVFDADMLMLGAKKPEFLR